MLPAFPYTHPAGGTRQDTQLRHVQLTPHLRHPSSVHPRPRLIPPPNHQHTNGELVRLGSPLHCSSEHHRRYSRTQHPTLPLHHNNRRPLMQPYHRHYPSPQRTLHSPQPNLHRHHSTNSDPGADRVDCGACYGGECESFEEFTDCVCVCVCSDEVDG